MDNFGGRVRIMNNLGDRSGGRGGWVGVIREDFGRRSGEWSRN